MYPYKSTDLCQESYYSSAASYIYINQSSLKKMLQKNFSNGNIPSH